MLIAESHRGHAGQVKVAIEFMLQAMPMAYVNLVLEFPELAVGDNELSDDLIWELEDVSNDLSNAIEKFSDYKIVWEDGEVYYEED